ncbi:glycosyltransferase [Sphaerimonospora thailandensis]|uniref:glycosyltransferase n=1 Tax=Sphaerimonospora thailandensis TaxID=795644 RepID=UPI00194EE4F3|nr:glycosyltransferase [Sphaerimonospora thailandensis]
MSPRKQADLQRVALLNGQLGLGGAERQLTLLALELRARGVEVCVLLLTRGGPHEATLRDAGIAVHHLGFVPWSSGPLAPVRNIRAFCRMVRLLRRFEPDVLHAFLMESYLLGTPAARLARVPVMVSGRRGVSNFKKRNWAFEIGTMVTHLADHVVANAVAVARDARTVERIPAHKISVIYNGLSRSAFDPVEPELIDTRLPVVVCVAGLRPEKGHRFLIDAAAILSRRGRPCTVALVGDGAERENLEARTRALGVDVRFLGTRMDVRPLLAGADVVVLPSTAEGLSNAIMEAMAAGRPVVATAIDGNPELLEDRGVLVPPADAAALSDGILRVLDDQEFAAGLATAARAWARKNLDLDMMVDEHVALYRRLLEERCAR